MNSQIFCEKKEICYIRFLKVHVGEVYLKRHYTQPEEKKFVNNDDNDSQIARHTKE